MIKKISFFSQGVFLSVLCRASGAAFSGAAFSGAAFSGAAFSLLANSILICSRFFLTVLEGTDPKNKHDQA
tara:strand:- start:47 stop:259 length:213 start_codon:yes stop_codon:yes gene_type:complete